MIAEGDITRCVGDAIALVVAEDRKTLERAKKLVKVEYEELDARPQHRRGRRPRRPDHPRVVQRLRQPRGAQEQHLPAAPRHPRRRQGGPRQVSAYTVTDSASPRPSPSTPSWSPSAPWPSPYKDGVKVWSTDQGAYDTRKECAHMLGWDAEPERVVVETMLVGGGFGGKEDVSGPAPRGARGLQARRARQGRFLTRAGVHRTSTPSATTCDGTFTLGCDENGIFTGLDCEINFDTGAYASLCGPVLERACTHSVGPYKLPEHRHPRLRLLHEQPARRAPSAASACASPSSPSNRSSTCSPRRSASIPGRFATATPSSRAPCCPTARSPTAPRPSRRPSRPSRTPTTPTPAEPASPAP